MYSLLSQYTGEILKIGSYKRDVKSQIVVKFVVMSTDQAAMTSGKIHIL